MRVRCNCAPQDIDRDSVFLNHPVVWVSEEGLRRFLDSCRCWLPRWQRVILLLCCVLCLLCEKA